MMHWHALSGYGLDPRYLFYSAFPQQLRIFLGSRVYRKCTTPSRESRDKQRSFAHLLDAIDIIAPDNLPGWPCSEPLLFVTGSVHHTSSELLC